MKVTGSDERSEHVNEAVRTPTKKGAEKQHTPPDISTESQEGAIVNLSERSKDVQRAQQAMNSQLNVRSEKVRAIQEKVQGGSYEIDYEKTAEKMVKASFHKNVSF